MGEYHIWRVGQNIKNQNKKTWTNFYLHNRRRVENSRHKSYQVLQSCANIGELSMFGDQQWEDELHAVCPLILYLKGKFCYFTTL